MKKILFLVPLIILAGCQPKILPVKSRSASVSLTDINIGTTANDGTGDPLRTAFGKVNSNNTLIENAFATVSTTTEVRGIINDSIDYLRDNALPAEDIFWQKTDTIDGTAKQLATQTDIENLEGGGGGYSKYKIQFVVGASGFPANGDSTVTHTTWAGKEVELYRDGLSQRYNSTATNTVDGFRLNNTTGAITVNPLFSTGEIIKIDAYNPVTVEWLTLTGTESTLLTGLRAGYKLDESSGTAVTDVTGTYSGTSTGTAGVTGRYGYGRSYATNQYSDLGTSVADLGTSDFTISLWVYMPDLLETPMALAGNFGTAPYFQLLIDDTNKAGLRINFNGTDVYLWANSALSATTWTHVAATVDRDGNATLFINGSAQTDVESISTYSAVSMNSNNTFAIGRMGSWAGYYLTGTIDDVYIHTKILSAGEFTEIQGGPHPW